MGWIKFMISTIYIILNLFIIGMLIYILWEEVKEKIRLRRSEKKFYKENIHDKNQIVGLGYILNDDNLTDFEKVSYIKEALDILDEVGDQ